jgi:cysteine synthase
MKNNILDTIGNTPIVCLNKIVKKYKLTGNIYMKLEFYNPGLSKKDRIAKYIIEKARENGELKDNQEVVEVTSGNTGIGLAITCTIYEHPFTAFISSSVSRERIILLKKLGAKVIVIDSEENCYGNFSGKNFDKLMDQAKTYCKNNNAFFVNQFNNIDNIKAQEIFAKEAKDEFDKENIKIDFYADFIGTGGTLAAMINIFPDTKFVLIEPENAAAYKEKKDISGAHIIQGGGYGKYDLKFIDEKKIAQIITVKNKDIVDVLDDLITAEGILASFSTAANLYGAITLLKENPGSNIFITCCDSFLKYLSNV